MIDYKKPNLQNIPLRSSDGRRIRDMFDRPHLYIDYAAAERVILTARGHSWKDYETAVYHQFYQVEPVQITLHPTKPYTGVVQVEIDEYATVVDWLNHDCESMIGLGFELADER